MKKKMKSGVRIAALAAVSVAGLGLADAAQAQGWMELRTWSAPRVYEEAPASVYREAPRYATPDALPRRAVRRIVERHGFEVIGPMRFTGESYIVPVEDMHGRVQRVVVDASSGELVERLAASGPRPPANIGRSRGRYAAAPDPYATDLPPLPVQPRGGWRGYDDGGPVPPPAVNERERAARERYARQFPDGAETPRSDFEVVPGLRPVAPPPSPKAVEQKKSEPAKRATKKPQKAQPKREAVRTPAERPAAQKPAEAKPVTAKAEPTSKLEPAKDAAKHPATEAPKPVATKPEPPKEAAKTQPAEADTPKAASLPPAAKAAVKKATEKSNASMLRRPSSKADEAKTGERKGVAEAPVISSGAEPQRKSPRVVYPGPGAPAPTQPSANDSD